MNILVTGGAGFIGSNVVDAYIDVGHNVVIADNMSKGIRKYVNPKAEFCNIDIRDENISEIFKKYGIEILNHHAAQIDLRKSISDPKLDADINVLGSINLLEAALKNNIKKVIFPSSGGSIYGEHEYFPADENHRIAPFSPYGINKLMMEYYLHYYNYVYGLDYVVLRYANAYGPRQGSLGESGVVSIFANKLIAKENPVINGDGEQTRDYVYVKDVARANVLALKAKSTSFYNISTSVETSVNHIYDKMNEYAGTNFKRIHGPAKIGEQKRSVLSSEKIYKELGWKPKVSVDEGLKLTFEYFKKQAV